MNNTEKRLRNKGWLSFRSPEIHIDVLNTSNVVMWVVDNDGNLDFAATDKLVEGVIAALDTPNAKWGGFRAAGGHWYLEKNYDPKPLQDALRDHFGR